MTNFIGGKEALIALANGDAIQYKHDDDPRIQETWTTITNEYLGDYSLNYFLNEGTKWKFRLKPKTITINGIEVPKPFKQEEGEKYWYITDSKRGYSESTNVDCYRVGIAAWRTEEEAKQVVAALRQVFGGAQ